LFVQQKVQAYKQAPWRIQLQWIGILLLVLVVGMLIAGVYLYVSAEATAAGTNIRALELEQEDLKIRIADLNTQLAYLRSAAFMESRAEALGYRQARQEDIIYVSVPGYSGREVVLLAPPPGNEPVNASKIKPAYRESLWDWLYRGTFKLVEERGLQP
jgi:cell division protein FtsB